LGRWINRDPIGEEGGINQYVLTNNNTKNRVDYLGQSELSEGDYTNHANKAIDVGIVDPDIIFKVLVNYYFLNDDNSGGPFGIKWDCQDDMEEIFDALGDVLATNFKGQPHGSAQETTEAKRFRKVRNWVESVTYWQNPKAGNQWQLRRAIPSTNNSLKFGRRMDAVMHFFASGAISANFGETYTDLVVGPTVEIGDAIKGTVRGHSPIGDHGFSTHDLAWNRRGTELQNDFDVSECKCRKLAEKFRFGKFSISDWRAWYGQPDSVLYN
jgi:hypothetical protein